MPTVSAKVCGPIPLLLMEKWRGRLAAYKSAAAAATVSAPPCPCSWSGCKRSKDRLLLASVVLASTSPIQPRQGTSSSCCPGTVSCIGVNKPENGELNGQEIGQDTILHPVFMLTCVISLPKTHNPAHVGSTHSPLPQASLKCFLLAACGVLFMRRQGPRQYQDGWREDGQGQVL